MDDCVMTRNLRVIDLDIAVVGTSDQGSVEGDICVATGPDELAPRLEIAWRTTEFLPWPSRTDTIPWRP